MRYAETRDMDVYYNLDDIWMSFNTKCNLVDTIEGTIILNGVANHLISIDKRFTPLVMIIKVVDLSSIIMDLSDMSRWINSLMKHRDSYNAGEYAGKFAKLLTQAYMTGFLTLVIDSIVIIINDMRHPQIDNPPIPHSNKNSTLFI